MAARSPAASPTPIGRCAARLYRQGGRISVASGALVSADGFPSTRYTGIFQIEVPGTMAVVGTGVSAGAPVSVTPKFSARLLRPWEIPNRKRPRRYPFAENAPPPPPMENERMLYTFRVDKPEAAGTFVISPLQLSPEHAQGMSFSVYTPPAEAKTAQVYADTARANCRFFQWRIWRAARPGIEDRAIAGWHSGRICRAGPSAGERAPVDGATQCAPAGESRGATVVGRPGTAASASDVWITDGLSRYSEGLYVEETFGQRRLEQSARGFRGGRADV